MNRDTFSEARINHGKDSIFEPDWDLVKLLTAVGYFQQHQRKAPPTSYSAMSHCTMLGLSLLVAEYSAIIISSNVKFMQVKELLLTFTLLETMMIQIRFTKTALQTFYRYLILKITATKSVRVACRLLRQLCIFLFLNLVLSCSN